MSSEQPSSGRPTGPPSGPLSGPSQPSPTPPDPTRPSGQVPPEPPSGASGRGGTGGPGGTGGSGGGPGGSGGPGGGSGQQPAGPGHPWWRSAPRIALMVTAAVVAVVLIVVLTRSDDSGGSAGGEVFLQAAGKSGPDPFTESTATDSSTPPETPTATPSSSEPANVTRAVDGSSPGLYGGTRNVASCDVEKQIKVLGANPAKNDAFASVAGVEPSDVPAYLRALTPVQLRMDTRVTNHGYRDGAATSYQAVLQSGTAVLVDDRGVPRVRCACGNPLRPPVALKTTPEPKGDSWPSYRPQNVVVIERSTVIINVFVLYDPDHDEWFTRPSGDTGGKDKKTTPPVNQPSPSVSTSFSEEPPSKSPKPCPSSPSGDSTSPCPSSVTPSTSPPSEPETPTSEPSSEPKSPETAGSPPDDTTTTESASLYGTPESITPGS
ncbi:DUF6777 domain-containing protein [Streptomyces europaeiscabiei]|uniref:DUF6777 domain-containing protein n=1 Tax=Streptomyces europaeiscabiei TaxID=146819 RepID=UPI002E29008C|nr:DUF6777 domain-containing protein [Streptomyces europaeiscabiei]